MKFRDELKTFNLPFRAKMMGAKSEVFVSAQKFIRLAIKGFSCGAKEKN